MSLFNRYNQLYKIAFMALFGIVLLLVFKIISYSQPRTNDDDLYISRFHQQYGIYSPPIPVQVLFADEVVPIERFDVLESLDKELIINLFWQSQTMLTLKRTHRYFPIMDEVLKRNNIPLDLKYIAVAESGLTNALSPSGARGFWQFMQPTADQYKLEMTTQIDERYHLEKATEAACKYFRDAYGKYKNWALVAASYNGGMGMIDAQMRKQGVTNFYDLHLTDETARYFFRLVAFKLIFEQPDYYGFHLRDKDYYKPIPTRQIKLDSSVTDWANFALYYGSNYKMLKMFNPWIRDKSLQNPKNIVYHIVLPSTGVHTTDIIDEDLDTHAVIEKNDTLPPLKKE